MAGTAAHAADMSYVIVGAGPGGLQASHLLKRAGIPHTVLERADGPGSFFLRFPRHRAMLSINKRFNIFPEDDFNLRHDWNSLLGADLRFTSYSEELFPHADAYHQYLCDFASRYDLPVEYSCPAVAIRRDAKGFAVTDARGGTHHCRRVLMATGPVAPRVPDDVPGIELAVGYEDHSLNQSDYIDKRVAIIGRGNSAFEVAKHLAGHAGLIHVHVWRPVKHAWATLFAGDVRAVNNDVFDMYHLKSLHATLGVRPREISRRSDGALDVIIEMDCPGWSPPQSMSMTAVYDVVIRCTGWNYVDASVFDRDCAPVVDDRGKLPVLDAAWQTSVPGLHYIGTAMQARDRIAGSPAVHGFRYNIRALVNLLRWEDEGVEPPGSTHRLRDADDIRRLGDRVIQRLSTTSALYHQHGVLCDAIVVNDDHARLFYELPLDLAMHRPGPWTGDTVVIMTLEPGSDRYSGDVYPLDLIYGADPRQPERSPFVHPVLRAFRKNELQEELHLGESLVMRWDRGPAARQRVVDFLGRVAAGPPTAVARARRRP